MSERTQAEGRNYYTERDFTFVPPASPTGDSLATIIKLNREWERQMLAAVTKGNPVYDAEAKAAILNPAPTPDPEPPVGG